MCLYCTAEVIFLEGACAVMHGPPQQERPPELQRAMGSSDNKDAEGGAWGPPRMQGGMMEEWHQKLHNNTSPDDVAICEALLAYIDAGLDTSAYWATLKVPLTCCCDTAARGVSSGRTIP